MVDGGITLGGVRQGKGLDFQPPNGRFYPSMSGVAPWEMLFNKRLRRRHAQAHGGARDLRRQRVLHGDDP